MSALRFRGDVPVWPWPAAGFRMGSDRWAIYACGFHTLRCAPPQGGPPAVLIYSIKALKDPVDVVNHIVENRVGVRAMLAAAHQLGIVPDHVLADANAWDE